MESKAENKDFPTAAIKELYEKLEAIPKTDRGINFHKGSPYTRLTVYGETAVALMHVLDNVDAIGGALRYLDQISQSHSRISIVVTDEILQKLIHHKKYLESAPMMLEPGEPLESRRVSELLEANNRYLEDARAARRELANLKSKLRI